MEVVISRVEFVRALEQSHGYVQRTARVLGVHCDVVRLRLKTYKLVEYAEKLRSDDAFEHLKIPKYKPDATPAERLRWLETVDTAWMSKQERMRISCARYYWRRRVQELKAA